MKIIKWLDDNIERMILLVLFVAMTVITVLQVFMRYVMQNSLTWSEEFARFCFIWLIYIGISYGVKRAKHVRVEAVLSLFKSRGKLIINLIANVLFLYFAIYATYYGFTIMNAIQSTGQVAPSLGVPMSIMYLGMPIGMLLTTIRLIQRSIYEIKLFREGKDNESPLEDEQQKLNQEQDQHQDNNKEVGIY
ncbi:TRAP transporter small permease [Lysinibacillus telephonicus]|uniref:TRAP transporter small permease n=1 Tax=Lysinibacillus telephonicus TaxID=1714840 RepID=A0A3S0JZF1_9BACI|nr:TRAP transporter small permease [Lysinibacillus telephonicus]RTQ96125.1 TRAP transporter small permease [Lysinibacillus telephonicus]